MVLKYLAVAALAAGATYGLMRSDGNEIIPPVRIERCSFTDGEGNDLAITQGPLGPRIGDLDYIAGNLSHEEKIRFITSTGFDGLGVIERMAVDLYENRDRVFDDIYRSLERAVRGGL